MSNTANEWTLDGFVDHFDFVHHKMLDHKYVWVLGAGASYASGIPLGSQLVDLWLKEMQVREDSTSSSLEEWATAPKLGMKNFEFGNRAAFYPQIYDRRFRDYPDEGYAYLESVMSGKDPSPGYSILAAALAEDPPRHNVVITTNFDNLVADALSIYTDTFPFVAGHESLTGFVRVSMRRPLICKIHRDLLLGPQSDSRSLKRLHDAWGTALRALFLHYTPLFIGYGGNDDTLVDLLESLEPEDIKGQLVWCYYEEQKPSDRIVEMVANLEGILIPAPDFDLLMVLLGERMEISLLDDEIGSRAAKRTQRYRDRILRLDTVKHPTVTKALADTMGRSGGWWAWETKARAEVDLDRRETVYRQGIQQCQQSAELHGSFAVFMYRRGNNDEAERLYRKSVELDPNHAVVIGNFAVFMDDERKDPDEAERLYRRSLELDPNSANNTGNFAVFMKRARKDYDEAERLYRKALELDPNHVHNTGNFAVFMERVRKDYDEAERLYRKALELDPNLPNHTVNFAQFLGARDQLDEASDFAVRAWHLLDKVPSSDQAEIAFTRWLFDRVSGRDGAPALGRLRTLFQAEFLRSPWSFDELLTTLLPRLVEDEHALAHKLAEAILDETKVTELDGEPIWKAVDPIPLDVPWPG